MEVILMLLGKYYVSDHAKKQYSDRVYYKGSVEQSIKNDLRTLNIRNIVRTETCIHVFTKNSKEFIFLKRKNTDTLCLKTIIKRNAEDNKRTIEKRKALVK
jgi:hypothetical protein